MPCEPKFSRASRRLGSRWCLVVLALAGAPPAQALTVGVSAGWERLSGGRPGWREQGLSIQEQRADKTMIAANLRKATRFGSSDTELALSGAFEWRQVAAVEARLTRSAGADFLPRTGASLRLARVVGPGWVVGGSWERRDYAALWTHAWAASIEKYVSEWRVASTVVHTRSATGGVGTTVRAQLDRYFEQGARLGLLALGGKELDPNVDGAPVDTIASAAITARFPLTAAWTLQAELSAHRQGSAYRRGGVRVGLDRRF